MKNIKGVSLITYANSFHIEDEKQPLQNLETFLSKVNSQNLFSRIHILPFYEGEKDGGFSISNHKAVRNTLGTNTHVKAISKKLSSGITADLVLNHLDSKAPEFQDVIKKGRDSEYWDLFLKKEDVFFNDDKSLRKPTKNELALIHRPRPTSPFTTYNVGKEDEKVEFWTTFTSSQIDLNWNSQITYKYMKETIKFLAGIGVNLIRLDAAYYPAKKAGTNCFGIPKTFEIIEEMTAVIHENGMKTLLEIHATPDVLVKAAKIADYVYSFADPIIILDAIYNQDTTYLKKLFNIDINSASKGSNKIRVTATHDGIGPTTDGAGILPQKRIDELKLKIYEADKTKLSQEASGDTHGNVDIYQVNCTFWDALSKDQKKFLLAKAIQLFLPGIPQIYYIDLLVSGNDLDFRKGEGRDINRQKFTEEEIQKYLNQETTKKLMDLINLRNTNLAFSGEVSIQCLTQHEIEITWENKSTKAKLKANLKDYSYKISL